MIIKLLSGYKKEAETDLDSVEFAHINLISSQILWIFPSPPNAVKESFCIYNSSLLYIYRHFNWLV